jgi:acyl carrier protein
MINKELFTKIISNMKNKNDIITDLNLDEITDDTHMVRELGFNSIYLMNLIESIEDLYDVEIPDDDLELSKFETVGGLLNYVENILESQRD